jgi:hypothetical protein
VGRPYGDAENGLGELDVKRWRQKGNDIEECAFVVKKANVFRGLYSQGVSK